MFAMPRAFFGRGLERIQPDELDYIPRFAERPVKGYHINSLTSPWLSWELLVEEFREAKARSDRGDPEPLKTFVTGRLAEPWTERMGADVKDADHYWSSKHIVYPDSGLPNDIVTATAGCDVQKSCIHVEVCGWTVHAGARPIMYLTFHGDPSQRGIFAEIRDFLALEFKREDQKPVKVAFALMDSGGLYSAQVKNFLSEYDIHRGILKPCVGRGFLTGGLVIPSQGGKQFSIDVDRLKSEVYFRAESQSTELSTDWVWPKNADGSDPRGYTLDCFEQYTAESRTVESQHGQDISRWRNKAGKANIRGIVELTAMLRFGGYVTPELTSWNGERRSLNGSS